MFIEVLRAGDEKAEAVKRAARLEKHNLVLREDLKVQMLDTEQKEMVQENASEIEDRVDEKFRLDYHDFKLEKLLGSGSFGDCYKGWWRSQAVAIKKARTGMIDEQGFKAFAREVYILSVVQHENIVSFLGYVGYERRSESKP